MSCALRGRSARRAARQRKRWREKLAHQLPAFGTRSSSRWPSPVTKTAAPCEMECNWYAPTSWPTRSTRAEPAPSWHSTKLPPLESTTVPTRRRISGADNSRAATAASAGACLCRLGENGSWSSAFSMSSSLDVSATYFYRRGRHRRSENRRAVIAAVGDASLRCVVHPRRATLSVQHAAANLTRRLETICEIMARIRGRWRPSSGLRDRSSRRARGRATFDRDPRHADESIAPLERRDRGQHSLEVAFGANVDRELAESIWPQRRLAGLDA